MRRTLLPLILTLALAATGCDYSIVEQHPPDPVSPGNGARVAIVVTPGAATVAPKGSARFRAIVTGSSDTTVTWSVVAGGGAVYPDGLYVAPDSIGSATIRARSNADTTKSAVAQITISRDTSGGGQQDVFVTVSPSTSVIAPGATVQLAATVVGTTNTLVTWRLVGSAPGVVSSSGLYVAPATLTQDPTTVAVEAVSVASPTSVGRASVRVTRAADPDFICFEREILPIFVSNCAMSGCHDPATREEGFDFTTAAGVLRGVRPGDARESKIIKAMTEPDKPEERMPPPPRQLTSEQIEKIRRWINDGADVAPCPPPAGDGCDTTAVTFRATVRPVLADWCVGCHTGGTDFNRNVDLSTHAGVRAVAQSGQLLGAISHANGYIAMPQGSAKLDDCTIAKIRAWIVAGAQDN